MEKNNQERMLFDEVVATYDRIRPNYPAQLFSDMLNYVGAGSGKKAIEIGAGTGKATRPLLDAGYDVMAIEIGANMAEFLGKEFAQHDRFQVVCDSFEDAALTDGAYDLIYAATAFHWVDADVGCPKALRLLKDGGAIALFRYTALPADGDPLYEDIQAVYAKHYTPYTRLEHVGKADYAKPAELKKAFGFDDLAKYGFVDVTLNTYDTVWTFSADNYLHLLDTFSDHRALKDSDREALYAGVKAAIVRHGGQISVDYVVRLYMGKKQR